MKKTALVALTALTFFLETDAMNPTNVLTLDTDYVTCHAKDDVFTLRTDKEIMVSGDIITPTIKFDVTGLSFICLQHNITASEMVISALSYFIAKDSTLTSATGSITLSAGEDAVYIGSMNAFSNIVSTTKNFYLTGIMNAKEIIKLTAADKVVFKDGWQVDCKKFYVESPRFIEL